MTGGGGRGGGRCPRLRKSMGCGGGATETKKTESNNNIPNSEITEKPSGSPEITELPLTSVVELDLYTQARKVLSFRSPFDSENSPAHPVSISGANTLPGGLSYFLTRHSDGWKRHKKLHSGSKKKSSTLERPHAGNIWAEMEGYFRDLTTEDIDKLAPVSAARFSGIHKCFLIPSLDDNNTLCGLYTSFNRTLATACERDSLNSENEVELISNDKAEVEGMVGQEDNEPRPMDVDGDGGELNKLEIKEKSYGEKTDERELAYFNGIDWLLGSKRKIYLASERHSKKRLLGMDTGMEKLLAAHAVQGLDAICHYCSCGDMGDPLNCLIKCGSCGMMVHQRCYGVQEDVGSSWLCSWCNRKNDAGLSTGRPCLLCPKQGGALKPLRRRGLGSDNGRSEVEFAHLFCCQWIPEVYLENTMTMEPVMNLDELKDTRKKLLCYLCKVKYGACVRCSNGDCRTSFHPICAREARHRMEIWGRRGCEEVELHAFCAKHSEVEDDSGHQSAGDISLTAGVDCVELNDIVTDGDNILDIRLNSKSHAESADLLQPADKETGNENDSKEVNAHSAFNFTMILKKLIDLGKVDARDVASDIGVSANSLNTMLTDNHMVPEVECKLVKWLKSHAHIGSTQKTFKVKIGSLAAPKAEADVAEGPGYPGAVSVEEFDNCETVCVKSVPSRRRTKSRIRIMKDDNSSFSGDKINGGTEGGFDISLPGQSLSEDGLIVETKQKEQMIKHSLVLM
ncbi:hypothetical protein CDL12_11496 [Handroanthus impetiginosus]|uniref:Uncharacterized protein n=1 Tax=Handroanthus impetiginosus TaxID=429701 RepID=A0A2G9HE88_9LAMI|nr:hypothetical protein CDL12_11496 [Handroanthus impetiginosus]